MAFTTKISTYKGKNITVPTQKTEEHNGDLITAKLPVFLYWDGRDKSKRTKDGELHLGLGEIRVALEELPQQSIIRLFEYGVTQYFNDSIASAEDAAGAHAKLTTRLDLLISGDLTARRPNPVKKAEANPDFALAAKLFPKQLTKLTEKAFGGPKPVGKDKEGSAKWLAAQAEAMKLLLTSPVVKKTVEEEKERLAALAAQIAEEEDDILAGLFDDEGGEDGEGDSEGEDDEGNEDGEPEGENKAAE